LGDRNRSLVYFYADEKIGRERTRRDPRNVMNCRGSGQICRLDTTKPLECDGPAERDDKTRAKFASRVGVSWVKRSVKGLVE